MTCGSEDNGEKLATTLFTEIQVGKEIPFGNFLVRQVFSASVLIKSSPAWQTLKTEAPGLTKVVTKLIALLAISAAYLYLSTRIGLEESGRTSSEFSSDMSLILYKCK